MSDDVLLMDGQAPFDDLNPPKESAFGRLFKKFLSLYIGDITFTDLNVDNLDAEAVNAEVLAAKEIEVDMAGGDAIAGLATLSAGTVTVTTTKVRTGSVIQLTPRANTNAGLLDIQTITDGTSFVIRSASGTDARVIGWSILNPES